MRALVTGGHGFVGSHLVHRLLAEGITVRCLSRRSTRPRALEGLDVEVAPGDLRGRRGLEEALRGVDEVYHLAGLTSSLSRRAMFATNAEGTARLLAAATAARLPGRFVLCSSSSVTGPQAPGSVPDESAPCLPLSWYAQSKLAAEVEARAAMEDLAVTILRPPAVYGPRDSAWLPLFQAAARGLSLVAGRPTKRYNLIYAPDLAEAFVAAARSEATRGGTWFAAHAETLTLLDLVAAAEAAVGRRARRLALPESSMRLLGSIVDLASQWTGRASVLGGQRMLEVATGDWTCDGGALERATGWRASTALREGFAATAEAYRAAGLLP